jgi:hypothetical protein
MINKKPWKLTILFFLMACLVITNIPFQAKANDKMQGIYVLPAEGKGIDIKAAKAPFVTGYSIRVSWKQLEPVKGQYNWQPIDDIINLAKKNGKYITLRILAGILSPNWVIESMSIPKLEFVNRNRNKEGYGRTVHQPAPWDTNYLNTYYLFLEALAKRYSNESLLYWIAVSGPVMGPATPHLPKDQETVNIMERQGLTKEKWRKVWEEAIDRTSQAFPQKSISLCLDIPPYYPDLADQLAAYAVSKYGHRMCLQSNGLSAKFLITSKRNQRIEDFLNIFPRYKDKATIGFQMTWAAAWKSRGRDRLGPLDEAINAGIKLGASYLEIYQDDIIDPANAPILADASKRLGAVIRTGAKESKIDSKKEDQQTASSFKENSIEGMKKTDLRSILSQLNLTRD